MNNGSDRKILFISAAGLGVALFVLSLLTPLSLPATGQTDASHNGAQQNIPNLQLRVDSYNHARVFCNGVKVVVSLADFFEFFELNLNGSRNRIYSGPWKGELKEDFPGHFTLTGHDPASGVSYSLGYHQADLNSIVIDMVYKAPSRPANIGFDIVKLSPDFLKDAELEVFPQAGGDVDKIPAEATPFADRVLLKNKSRVLIKSSLCDIEISELGETASMLLADGRDMPWDKDKSIYFIGGKDRLVQGQTYSFRYSIRFLPPTGTAALGKGQQDGPEVKHTKQLPLADAPSDKILTAASATFKGNSWSFFALPPKEEVKKDGQYVLQSQDGIFGSLSATAETILARELEYLTNLRLPVKDAAQGNSGRGLYIERITQGGGLHLPAEGFEIVATPEKITVRGGSERACLYGVYAVLGRFSREANDWRLQCGTLRDWPDLPVRGVCIAMSKPFLRDVELMKRYLDAFSRARSNLVIFLHDPLRIRSWQKNVDDGGWTKKQMKEIGLYARSLEMDVWGGMGSAFKADQFPEINISKDSNLYNPFEESSYNYLFTLYSELLNVYNPSTLLVSHDEMQGLSVYTALSGQSSADILSIDIRKIHGWLTSQNVKTAIWGDMLLDYAVWEKDVGAANSRNPAFNSGATHLAIKQIPSDVSILDWHYDEKKDFGSIEYFRRHGFSVIGCPWHNPNAARTMAQSAKKYGGSGVIATDWGFLSTFSPAATTLFAPLCAWSTNCVIGTDNRDVSALAEAMRPRGYDGALGGYSQIPIGLKEVSNDSTSDIFGLGNVLGLPATLSKHQKIDGITFDILSDQGGKTPNCVVVNDTGKFTKGKVVYQGGQSARVLAFLHTSLIEEPQVRSRRVGSYMVIYENGQTETISLVENWNITDIRSSEGVRRNDWTFIRSPDVLIGSQLGWFGLSNASVPLNLQMFTWRNPYPELKISSIRLKVDEVPSNSKIALIGLTFLQ